MDRYGVSGLQPGEAGAGRARTETAAASITPSLVHLSPVGPLRLSAGSYTKGYIPVTRVRWVDRFDFLGVD